jgi:hypothetical protein
LGSKCVYNHPPSKRKEEITSEQISEAPTETDGESEEGIFDKIYLCDILTSEFSVPSQQSILSEDLVNCLKVLGVQQVNNRMLLLQEINQKKVWIVFLISLEENEVLISWRQALLLREYERLEQTKSRNETNLDLSSDLKSSEYEDTVDLILRFCLLSLSRSF